MSTLKSFEFSDYCTGCPVFLDTEMAQRKTPGYCICLVYVERSLGLGGDNLCEVY